MQQWVTRVRCCDAAGSAQQHTRRYLTLSARTHESTHNRLRECKHSRNERVTMTTKIHDAAITTVTTTHRATPS
jgi:hypothetical protein